MTTQTQSTNKKPLLKRIKPLGWVLIALAAISLMSLIAVMARPLTSSIRALPTGAEAISTAPTITPYVKPTDTVAPTQTPLPGGWTQGQSLNGRAVLVPPPAVQQQIEEAYHAVFACAFAVDASDPDLKKLPEKQVVCDQAQKWMSYPVDRGNSIELATFGPLNPVTCTNDHSCTVRQAKLEFKGELLSGDICQQIKQSSPCVVRQGITGPQSYQLQIATVELQENGIWKITRWDVEQLPGPPPSP